MSLYSQVVQIDPSNSAAVQGYKDAQTKVQNAQAAQDASQAQQVTQQHDALTKDQASESIAGEGAELLSGRTHG